MVVQNAQKMGRHGHWSSIDRPIPSGIDGSIPSHMLFCYAIRAWTLPPSSLGFLPIACTSLSAVVVHQSSHSSPCFPNGFTTGVSPGTTASTSLTFQRSYLRISIGEDRCLRPKVSIVLSPFVRFVSIGHPSRSKGRGDRTRWVFLGIGGEFPIEREIESRKTCG